eukprot:TRINITY_DN7268_c1_g1_i1.p1 TRINITY_DN7268_c1_g1~~TRINITY_DN7268_c1_g1_i1.p1  ORF type:complete len:698 (+),score=165.84 TRINITY_DN7268_c1_g1_i1:161-2254(+)
MSDLCRYVEEGNIKAATELIKSGGRVAVNTPNNPKDRVYPIHISAAKGNVQMTELLLSYNAKTSVLDSEERTPLHNAAKGGHKDVVNLLLKGKIDMDSLNNKYHSPLHEAILNRHTEVARILLENKASVYEVDVKEQSALHMACQMGSKDIIESLIRNGASVSLEDASKHTAFEFLQFRRPHQLPSSQSEEKPNLQLLSKNLRTMLLNPDLSDITFVIDSGNTAIEKIHAHRCILKARAPTLCPKDALLKMVRLTGVSCQAFRLLLEWIYTASIEIDQVDIDDAFSLYQMAIEYSLPKLETFVEEVITSNLNENLVKPFFEFALKYKAEALLTKCSIFFMDNFKKIDASLFSKEDLLQIISKLEIVKSEAPASDELSQPEIKSEQPSPEEQRTPQNELPIEPTTTCLPVSGGLKVKVSRSTSSRSKTTSSSNPNKKRSSTKSEKTSEKSIKTEKTEKIEKIEKVEKTIPAKTEKIEKLESIVPVVEKKQAPDEMAGRTLEMCNTLIVQLMEDEKSPAFNQPVDYEKLNLPQYPLIINEPMDLRTVKMNLGKNRSRKFKTLKEFASKVRLVFDNARTFNQSGSQIYNDADYMSRLFERKYLELQKALGLSKGYDPPKEFVPPPSLPIPPAVDAVDMSRKVKDPPVQKKKRRNPSTATTTRTQRPKKRKTETEYNFFLFLFKFLGYEMKSRIFREDVVF